MASLVLAAAQPAINQIVPAWKIAGASRTASQVENVPAVGTEVAFDLPAAAFRASPGSGSAVDWIAIAYRTWTPACGPRHALIARSGYVADSGIGSGAQGGRVGRCSAAIEDAPSRSRGGDASSGELGLVVSIR